MNGAVYISFFQGQLESVLEQVVQLAVQEISKTVGSSLNALLLETAVKEQENRRLKLQLQSRENRARGTASCSDGGGSPAAGKNKAGKAAGDERADSSRTKPEQQQQQPRLHAPGGQSTEPTFPTDTRRLEQRGRIVEQVQEGGEAAGPVRHKDTEAETSSSDLHDGSAPGREGRRGAALGVMVLVVEGGHQDKGGERTSQDVTSAPSLCGTGQDVTSAPSLCGTSAPSLCGTGQDVTSAPSLCGTGQDVTSASSLCGTSAPSLCGTSAPSLCGTAGADVNHRETVKLKEDFVMVDEHVTR
ncbi:hypothetical protein INR49_011982 [Caranx melampygus]|nr:hypothetical protein INR49_011982 [Caranx melampygus]